MYAPLFRKVLYPLYETTLRRRRTLAYLDEYEASQWLPPEELEALQWRKLQALLAHCWDDVPFYRQAWHDAGVRAVADIRGPADFARLPIVHKQDIREHFDAMKARSMVGRLLYKTTGGSTGEPLTIGYTRESYERRMAAMFRGYGWGGAAPGTRALYLWGVQGNGVRDRLHHAAFNRRMLDVFPMSDRNMGRYADQVDAYRPEVLVGYVSSIVRLSRWLLEHGRRVHAPRSVLCAAEPLHDFQRELIGRAFGCPVFNTYGCREVMLVASECGYGGLHVNADHLRVELGRSHAGLAQVGAGFTPRTRQEVIVTDLHNYGMPLVRYANGDLATPRDGQCPCGRGLPMLAHVDGRTMDALRSPQGHYVGEYLEHLVFSTPGIRRFQAVQSQLDEIEVRIVRGEGFDPASAERIRARMRETYGDDLRLRFEYQDDIPLTPSGKLRVAISRLTAAAAGLCIEIEELLLSSGLPQLATALA